MPWKTNVLTSQVHEKDHYIAQECTIRTKSIIVMQYLIFGVKAKNPSKLMLK